MPAIEVDDVHRAFTTIVTHFRPPRRAQPHRHQPAGHRSAPPPELGDDVDVHPGATIGDDVEIGAGSTIHSGAHIMAGCKLGENVTIYPNAVLYENTHRRRPLDHSCQRRVGLSWLRLPVFRGQPPAVRPSWAMCEIGCDVEIGAGTTIDRGTYGPTMIGDGTKIDNLVMIAHNCRIGRHNMICSQVGVAGSTITGDFVVMAGQVGVRDHVHIGDGAILARNGRRQQRRAGRRPHVRHVRRSPSASRRFNSRPSPSCPTCAANSKHLQQAVDD